MHRKPAPTLLIPGLIWPSRALRDMTRGLPTPALCRLLGMAGADPAPPCDVDDALAGSCGLAPPLPAAALRRRGFGANRGDGHDGDWLCLDPVQLEFVERRLQLADPRRLALEEDEARELARALAPLFADLGELEATRPGAWHLCLRSATAAPHLPPPARAVGTRADGYLSGLDRVWRRALNEAQMLLHAHPVNRAREAAGRPLANSLWPWGGGALPAPGPAPFDVLFSASPVHEGLARHLGAEHAALPARWPADTRSASPLVVLDTLAAPTAAADAQAWREALAALEADWFGPLLAAMRSGALASLALHFTSPRGSRRAHLPRISRWAFWRRPAPLAVLAEA